MALSQNFDLEFFPDTNQAIVYATTDYLADYGMNLASLGAKIIGSLIGPDGTAVITWTTGSPCIDLGAGATQSTAIPLPEGTDDEILNGSYTLSLSLYLNPANINVGVNGAPDNEYYAPNTWLYQFLEVGDAFTVTGAGIPGNNGARTVLSTDFSTPNSQVKVSDALTTESLGGPGIAFAISHTAWSQSYPYNGCDRVEPCIAYSYDCKSTEFGSITVSDASVYGENTIVGSTLRIMHPSWTVIPYNTTDSVTNGTNAPVSKTLMELYEGVWSAQLNVEITNTQASGLLVTYNVEKIETKIEVWCASSLCGIQQCVLDLLAKVDQDLSQGGGNTNVIHWANIITYINMAWMYQDCGDSAKYQEMVGLILAEIQLCGCSCGCDENNPKKIQNVSADVANQITQLQEDLQFRLFDGVPGVNQDNTQGYTAGAGHGSVLKDINTGILYECTDDTTGAAVWVIYYDPSLINEITAEDVSFDPNPLIAATNVQDAIDDTLGITAFLESNITNLTTQVSNLTTEVNSKVESVTGTTVNNTDPQNPVINTPTSSQVSFSPNPALGSADTVQEAIDAAATLALSKVTSVVGLNTNNSDPENPVIQISVDGTTITGAGTPASPLQANGSLPYQSYVALITNANSIAQIYNDTGATISSSNPLTGIWQYTFSSAILTSGKTFISYTPAAGNPSQPRTFFLTRNSTTEFSIFNFINGILSNIDVTGYIEIRIYP
jgi:hypothetical protein